MSKAIGIDLGTTNSVMAINMQDIKVIQNLENEDLTRSAIGFYKGQIIVGGPAIDRMEKDTIISVKRLMGRAYSDSEIQRIKQHYMYDIVPPSNGTEEDVRVIIGGKEYSPIEISSMILKKLKEDAEERLKDKVDQAVITVPAYFTDKQREATRRAGQLAGLKVQKILDEPTAAAIAFGVDNLGPDDLKTILVYDMGGGTFDVSVLTIVGGVFAQEDIEGDMWLGGDDFDYKIVDHVLRHIQDEYGIDARENLRFMMTLKKEAEKAKKALSSISRTDIIVYGLLHDKDGNIIDVEIELSRDEFERMIEKDVKRSVDLVKKAIENARLTMNQIDNVLLVGGSSTIPVVRRAMAATFGEEHILINIDPMKCVAYGAAVLAARLGGKVECPRGHINSGDMDNCATCGEPLTGSIVLGGVTGMDYGIQTRGDKFDVIISKGSSYPTSEPVVRTFYTPADNIRRIKVPVYVGFNPVASQNEIQVTSWLELPENIPQNTPVDVAFKLDADSVLSYVKVSLKDGSGREIEVFPDRGGEKRSLVERKMEAVKKKWEEKMPEATPEAQEKIEKIYSELVRAANANNMDTAERKITEMEKEVEKAAGEGSGWKETAENLMAYANLLIREFGWLVDPQQTYNLQKLMEKLKAAVASNDEPTATPIAAKLNEELDAVPGLVQDLMAIVQAIGMASSRGDSVKADRVRSALMEIENALKRNDIEAVKIKFEELLPLLKDIFGASGKETGAGAKVEDLLSSVKMHLSGDSR